MISINTNLSSLITQRSLTKSTDALNLAIERMTTGFKINHASDNAANYSISTNLTTQLSSYDIAADNVASGIDLVNYASDIISQMQDKAARLNALSTQARNGTYGAQSLAAINSEASAIMSEIARLYNTAEYNDIFLFNRTDYTIAPHLPQAGDSGFIDETTLSATGPPRARTEYGGFIEDPITYKEQKDVDNLTAVSKVKQVDGFTENEYKIASVEDLVSLAKLTNAGVDTTGITFVLAKDLDLGAYCAEEIAKGNGGWTPIGDNTNEFKGAFDGNGHTIKNLRIEGNRSYQGLFGNINEGSAIVKNLGMTNAYIEGNCGVGILAGYANAIIQNCYVSGIVNGTGDCVGGLVGDAWNDIKKCYSISEVTNYSNAPNPLEANLRYVGGLVGRSTSTIADSYSISNVKTNGRFAGGLVGVAGKSITNCYATGDVISTGTYVGGLIGSATTSATVTNCYATCSVAGKDYTGGLIGNATAAVTNCYATGDVEGSGNYVGGLIGNITADVTNCYATGKAESSVGSSVGGLIGRCTETICNSYATGNVSGASNVGGLVGVAQFIDSSYSINNVTGTGGNIGGLAGSIWVVNITRSVKDSVSYSSVSSNNISKTGSFIGAISATVDGVNFGTLNISGCQAIELNNLNYIGAVTNNTVVIADYDMSTLLAGINDVKITDITTHLQVGIYGKDSCQLNFDTNFQFDLSGVNAGIENVEAFDAIVAFENLLSEKATQLGAVQNRLESALESIEVNINNLTSTRSTIRDADIAEVSSQYIQQQILQQASATLMATANQMPAIALQLI